MSLILVIFLAVVQGLTEFLPVSSSGHLVVSRAFLEPYLGRIESPLAFDIVVHLATALVTALFLHKELAQILYKLWRPGGLRERALTLRLIVATLPAVVVGLLAKEEIERLFEKPAWALNGFLVTALLLELAHRRQISVRATKEALSDGDWPLPSLGQALLIGLAQALAIFPGISRSGSTIAAGLLLGLPPRSAVLFSFFMLLPVVFGAVLLELKDLLELEATGNLLSLGCGFTVTMLTAYVALRFLLWVVEGAKLRWFAVYTCVLGLGLRLFI